MDKNEERIIKAKRYDEFKAISEHILFNESMWGAKELPKAKQISKKFGHSESTSNNILREFKKVFNN